jgi:uncharacterized membrane protein
LKKAIVETLLFLGKFNAGMLVFFLLIQYFFKVKASSSSLIFLVLSINACVLISFGYVIWTGYRKIKADQAALEKYE